MTEYVLIWNVSLRWLVCLDQWNVFHLIYINHFWESFKRGEITTCERSSELTFNVQSDESKVCSDATFASLHSNSLGQLVHSKSWCPLGSRWHRWHRCPHHQPLWRRTQWQAHRDWVTGGKTCIYFRRLHYTVFLMCHPYHFASVFIVPSHIVKIIDA